MQALLLFAAALIAAELFHRRDHDLGPDEESDRFSAAAPLAAAAAIFLGPSQALIASILCVGPVRRLQGDGWRDSAIRALSLGGAALAGGYAYTLAGSETGMLALPDDLLGLALLGVAFVAVKTLVIRLSAGSTTLEPDLLPAGAEVALGAAVAIAADVNLWQAALLVPVLLLIERLYGRMIALRREVASALETFANLVDERDPSTYRHSVRVAQSVRELAEALGLPRSDVQRLWWAGRLHDLGKVAVDAAVLRKPGRLDDAEWAAVRRAPRLSARLLQRFRFAAQQAKAVEYHRERLDGSGYYGAHGANLPLAAHFLIVADSFDAMTSERPFRRRLSREEALAEIEANAGTQFHPAIAKAFVAVQRDERPADVLSKEELSEIRGASVPAPSRTRTGGVGVRPELFAMLGVAAALVGVGIEMPEVVAGSSAVTVAGLVLWAADRLRGARLRHRLNEAFAEGERRVVFDRVVDVFQRAWSLQFAQLVDWHEDGAGGTVELRRGSWAVPDAELMSWLLREAESGGDVIFDDGNELGSEAATIALPLRRENSALFGFLVLGGMRHPPAHVLAIARSSLDGLGLALAEATETDLRPARYFEPARRGETVVFREGSDLSVIVVGPLLDTALEAIDAARDELSAELLLLPADGDWDADAVLQSVAKTSKVVLVHRNSGDELRVAEVAARIAEDAFHHLDAPVRRVRVPGADLVEQLHDLAAL
jgi:HD domain/Transketolase, C-terminal domain